MVNFTKMGLFVIFLYNFTINCVTTGTRNMPIDDMFSIICSEYCIKKIRREKMLIPDLCSLSYFV